MSKNQIYYNIINIKINKMCPIEITQEKFEAYEDLVKLRRLVSAIRIQSIMILMESEYGIDINREELFELIKHYNKYEQKYGK